MATHVARGHGGDGGERPPHGGARKIPAGCESSNPKRVRGKGRSLNMRKKFNAGGEKPLPVQLDSVGGTYKFIGDNGKLLTRFISNYVAEHVPLHFRSWQRVPFDYKDPLYPEIETFFDLDMYRGTSMWEGVRAAVNVDCQRAYKEHKHEVKNYFDEVGGYNDVEGARECPPEDMDDEVWDDMIDILFLDEGYRKQCVAGKESRAKLPHTSSHGSRSYADRRREEIENGEDPQHIGGWKQMRFKESRGWCTQQAEVDWEKIQREKMLMQEELGESVKLNEKHCLTRALGERRGHIRGVGRIPSVNNHLFPNEHSKRSQTSTSQSQNTDNPQVVALTQQMQYMQQYMQQMQQMYNNSFASVIPNFQPQPMPQFPIDPNMFSQNTPEPTNELEENENDEDLD